MPNPKFEITLQLETSQEPFGKNFTYLTRTDIAMELSRLLIRQKDIKKIKILSFKKLEAIDVLKTEAKNLREILKGEGK